MNDSTATTLYDHYKDTCAIVNDAVARRSRAMVYLIIIVGLFTFQTFFPSTSGTAVNDFLNFKFGLSIQLNLAVIGTTIWLLLLAFTIRYIQTAVYIERLYIYIHQTEEKINKLFGNELITREGKAYLSEYPRFSNWISALYTIVFPLILLFVSMMRMTSEWMQSLPTVSFGLIVDSLIFLALLVSILFYMDHLHFSKKKENETK